MTTAAPRAVVLLSGGVDSATALAVARAGGFQVHALSFCYGQRHQHELNAARRVAQSMGVAEHTVIEIDLRRFGGSALTADLSVPKGRSGEQMGLGIPITYVPARNTIFLSYALAWAEVLGAADLFIGVNADDRTGYPDCRPAYVRAYEAMANLATKAGVEGERLRIHTPVADLTKPQIVRLGLGLGVDYSLTSTCYDPSPAGEACSTCDACQIRLAAFAANGLADPIAYRRPEPTAA